MSRRLQVLASALACAPQVGCGRTVAGEALALVSVAGEVEAPWPGQRAVGVHVTLVNDTGAPVALHNLELSYAGGGVGFSAEPPPSWPEIGARAAVTVSFRVRLPPDGAGAASVDAQAVVLVGERVVRLEGAGSPWRFTYADGTEPSDLPVLLVTSPGDELDGGDGIAGPDQAGATLSLREALQVVHNRAAPHQVLFDPAVFPPGGSLAIAIGSDLPVLDVPGTVLDATGSSAALYADLSDVDLMSTLLRAQAPDLVVRSLTLRILNGLALRAVGADGLLLDGLRVVASGGGSGLEVAGSPDTVIRGLWSVLDSGYSGVDVTVESSDRALIEDARLDNYVGCSASADLVVRRVVGSIQAIGLDSCPRAQISELELPDVTENVGIVVGGQSAGTVIEDVHIAMRHEDTVGVLVRDCSPVTVRRTTILGPYTGLFDPIRLVGANDGVMQPVLEAVDRGAVSGTAAAATGTVEVYVDPDFGLGEWLGAAALAGGAWALDGLNLRAAEHVRAVVTDELGRTSEASAAVEVP